MSGPGSTIADRSRLEEAPRPSAVLDAGIAAELRDVLDHLRGRGRGVLLAFLLMAALGAVLAALVPRLYIATAQIMVDPRGLRVFDNEVVPGGQLSDVQSNLVETQARILRSDSILKPVVERERLAQDPDFDGAPHNIAESIVQSLRHLVSGSPAQDRAAVALANLGEAVRVQRLPTSFVLELSVSAREAEKAARLARAITETFIANAQQTREDSAKQVSEGLSGRLDALGAEVQRAETAVDNFKRRNNIVDANGRPLNEQQLGDLSNQLVSARVRTAEVRSRYEQIQRIQRTGALPDATSEVGQSAAITQLRNRYAEVKQAQDSLLTSLGPRHPSLLAAAAQLAGVKQQIAQEVARIAASARADVERARATEQGLERQLASVTQENGAVNTAAIRLRELEREAQSRRTVYESFLNRSRETREQGDLPTINISVISQAAAPLRKTGIPAPLVIIVVASFGATAAALLMLAMDRFAGRIMTPRQLSAATGLPLLAVARRRTLLRRWLIGHSRAVAAEAGPSDESLMAMHQLLLDAAPAQPPRIVLFLTGDAGAAAAVVPLDLARLAGEAGDRVLLVDTDGDALTRPFDDGRGADRGDWTPVRRTDLPNLSVLAWSEPFVQPHAAGAEAGGGALLQMARDHDFLFIHGASSDAAVRLRRLAEAATNIVLIVDADSASVTRLDAMRGEVGPFASKVDGFVWVVGAAPRRAMVGRIGPRRPAPPPGATDTLLRPSRSEVA